MSDQEAQELLRELRKSLQDQVNRHGRDIAKLFEGHHNMALDVTKLQGQHESLSSNQDSQRTKTGDLQKIVDAMKLRDAKITGAVLVVQVIIAFLWNVFSK